MDGYREESRRAGTLGCAGKWAIHPSQIAIAREAFSPTVAKVAEARKLVQAYAAAEAEGSGLVHKARNAASVVSLRHRPHPVAPKI